MISDLNALLTKREPKQSGNVIEEKQTSFVFPLHISKRYRVAIRFS